MVAITMALRGLSANKLRSLLTMLGVIIGVGAVIIAIGIGQGSKEASIESIKKLGTNVLTVLPGQQRRGQISFGFGSINTLKLEDAAAILRGCPSVATVSPGVQGQAQVKYMSRNSNTSIQGTGAAYPPINNHVLAEGKYFTEADVKSQRRVAVLGSTTARDLFDKQSPIGKVLRIKGQSFQVIGLFKEKGGLGFRNPDDAVYVPVTSAMRRLFGLQEIRSISIQARNEAVMNKALDEIDVLLRRRHKIATGGAADFIIFNQADAQAAREEQQDIFSRLITYLAIVSLLVGGIGIMNIMLVSVTERTREIGIRKAIGAKRRDILAQFLLEALFLSCVGGILGVILGYSGSDIVASANNWRVSIAPQTPMLAFSFSALVGVFFGFYPALKASNLSPIEALRYE